MYDRDKLIVGSDTKLISSVGQNLEASGSRDPKGPGSHAPGMTQPMASPARRTITPAYRATEERGFCGTTERSAQRRQRRQQQGVWWPGERGSAISSWMASVKLRFRS